MEEYRLLVGNTPADLNKQVEIAIDGGWRVYGNPTIGSYTQYYDERPCGAECMFGQAVTRVK